MTRGSADEPPRLHVLVVEDDPDLREQLQISLEALGCRLDVAADGAEAVRMVLKVRPDVVLMDLGMPILNGWDAIRRVRQVALDPKPYIIAFSASDDADARRMAFEAGCNEFIVKPRDVRGALRAYVLRTQHRSLSTDSD